MPVPHREPRASLTRGRGLAATAVRADARLNGCTTAWPSEGPSPLPGVLRAVPLAGFVRYYSRLVERASRRKEDFAGGGSVTLVLLQPSASVLPSSAERKEVYTLSDFEVGGFTQTVCSRVAMLEDKGIPITQDVLIRVGIPLPGSEHPAAGRGQRSQQHLEELTSLVDGHIDLRESLASVGRVPPIDPSNSLTRIGVGSTKLVGDHTASCVTSALRA